MTLLAIGHVMRRNGVENLLLTGKIEGKRAKDRQRTAFLKEINNEPNGKWKRKFSNMPGERSTEKHDRQRLNA